MKLKISHLWAFGGVVLLLDILFPHSFNYQIFRGIYPVPGPASGISDTVVNKTYKIPAIKELRVFWGHLIPAEVSPPAGRLL